jgi:hypothetical protein
MIAGHNCATKQTVVAKEVEAIIATTTMRACLWA